MFVTLESVWLRISLSLCRSRETVKFFYISNRRNKRTASIDRRQTAAENFFFSLPFFKNSSNLLFFPISKSLKKLLMKR